MQNQQDKTMEEKRLAAQRALEGEDRQKARALEEQKKREEEERAKRVEEEKIRQQEERERKIKEEQEQKEREREAQKKQEEEAQKQRKELLLKKIKPQGEKETTSTEIPVSQPSARDSMTTEEKSISGTQPGKTPTPQIRTYKNDVAEAIQAQNKSLASIAIEEQEQKRKGEAHEAQVKKPRNKLGMKTIVLSLTFLLVLGIGGGLFYYPSTRNIINDMLAEIKSTTGVTIIPRAPLVPALVNPQAEKEIPVPDQVGSAISLVAQEQQSEAERGTIKNIFFKETRIITTPDGKTEKEVFVSGVDRLLEAWVNAMPDALARSLSAPFMLGIHTTLSGENIPFLILTTGAYTQTFAGMFAWERALPNDFATLFGLPPQAIGVFHDTIIDSTDTRIAQDEEGNTVLLYALVDNKTVVITMQEITFRKIISEIRGQ